MKRAFAVLAVIVALAVPVVGEVSFKSLSVTETSQTWVLPLPQSTVTICNVGANEVYFRLFNENESPAAATNAYNYLAPGSATAPFCVEISKPSTQSANWKAFSVICSAGETATVYLYSI